MPSNGESIRVRRRMPAPREVVYEAWTTADGFRHWMCPGDVASAEATLDVRVGGAFRIVMRSPSVEHVQTGIYEIVEPPAKLVFTWNSSNHPPTRVIVEFLDQGEESEIVITHEQFTIPDIAKRYESGWATIADKLAAYLAKQRSPNSAAPINQQPQKGQRRRPMPTLTDKSSIQDHAVVPHEEWLTARIAFLAKEKEFTRLRDDLSRQRRELPWEKVDKQYMFDGPRGKEKLADLFENRSQLLVHHFMFNPAWDEGCKHCSFWADNWNGSTIHLNHRDVTFVAISRAPLVKLEAFKKRMGWNFKWLSSGGTDFNYDYYVSFTPEDIRNSTGLHNYQKVNPRMEDHVGFSVFYKDKSGDIFHTYSCYSRGVDMLNSAYHYLDLVPKGRDEDNLEFSQSWVRYHDKYED